MRRTVEEARGEDPQRAERLARRLGELASFLPRMIEVMARAVEEMGRLTAS